MRVLLDNNVNRRFARLISGHDVIHARELGWTELENGDLIATAQREGFNVVITCDKQIQYQQNLAGRKISIIVLNSLFIKLADIKLLAPQVNQVLGKLVPASFIVINPESN